MYLVRLPNLSAAVPMMTKGTEEMAVVWERVHDLIEQNHGRPKQKDCNRLYDERHRMVDDVMEQT